MDFTFDEDNLRKVNKKAVELPSMNRVGSFDGMQRQQSYGELDSYFLERAPIENNDRGSSLFFGLAVVFASVGAVTSMG